MESIWAGSSEDAFFSPEVFDHNRRLNQPEKEYSGRTSKNGYYVISVDVGRKSDNTAVTIIKVTPTSGTSLKSIVNLYAYEKMHMEDQCINIKKLFFKYNARALVVDGTGLGIGLLDYLVKNQTDPDTGDLIPNFGVMNDDDNTYKIYKNEDTILDAVYAIKANPTINTEMHMNAKSQLDANRVKFLIDERTAKDKLLSKKVGQEMTVEQKNEYLRPFMMTSILKEEIKFIVSLQSDLYGKTSSIAGNSLELLIPRQAVMYCAVDAVMRIRR